MENYQEVVVETVKNFFTQVKEDASIKEAMLEWRAHPDLRITTQFPFIFIKR